MKKNWGRKKKKKRLRSRSRLKETKDTWKLNATHDPELGPGLGKEKLQRTLTIKTNDVI